MSAQTTAEKFTFCELAGDVARAATEARDSGHALEDVLKISETVGVDGVQRQFMDALVSLVFTMDGVEGPLMSQVAIQMCQKQSGLK